MIIIIYIIAVAAALFLITLTNMLIYLNINRVNEDDYIRIKVHLLFGIIKLKFEIPYIDIIFNRDMRPGLKLWNRLSTRRKKGRTESKTIFGTKNLIETYKTIKDMLSTFGDILKYILSKLYIDDIKWHTVIGTGEAGITAIATGLIWILKSNVLAFVLSKKPSSIPDIKVVPDYKRSVFEVNFNCIIRVKIANIIIAGIRISLILLLNAISRKGSEDSERTSNTRFNENYNG